YGRPTNYRSLRKFQRSVQRTWKKWLGRRSRGRGLTGQSTSKSFNATRSYVPRSYALGPERRVIPEEPTGVIPRGGICEGGGPYGTMANLSGHAAGNGGYRQGDPTVSFDSLLLGRQHHTKPGPRHGPTRLRGEDPDDPLLLGVKLPRLNA